MKIYRLTLNKVIEPNHAMISSHVNERRKQKEEFYASRDSAEKRKQEMYEGTQKLLGYIPNFEAVIDEIEVMP